MTQKFDNSFKLNEEQLEQLKQLIPEAFKDGLVDIGALSDALSGYSDENLDIDDNLFGLTWPGKRQAKRAAAIPPVGTLVPVPGDGVDEETTKNIYIEGDNLEVLKIIRKAYFGKIKMIYIDPPYNTGNDFIYPDDFSETEESYKRRTGQIDENGMATSTNKKATGRFHSKWCSMMYPRLHLARDLLTDDGVIFISIDDNEVAQLRKICDEVFGEGNFVANIVWQKKTSPDARMDISAAHDYILLYAKHKEDGVFLLNSIAYEKDRLKNYKNPDNDGRGLWASVDITGQTGRAPKSQFYEITTPSGKKYLPPEGRCWAMAQNTFNELYKDNRLWFGEKGDNRPRLKKFLLESEGMRPWTWWDNKFASHNQEGNQELMEIFNGKLVFDNPKPTKLIDRIISLITNNDSDCICLDFFSGSGTFAESIMRLNRKDDGKRVFLLVQLSQLYNEKGNEFRANNIAYSLGYANIAEIGKERIRRAGKAIKKDAGLNAENLDTGFKVFRLAPSNFKPAGLYTGNNVNEISDWFSGDPLVEGWKPKNLITEVMLKEGFPLDSTIAELDVYKKNKVYQVSSISCDHSLIICLDTHIENDTIEKLDIGELDIFICLDSAITDQEKARLDDKGRIIVI